MKRILSKVDWTGLLLAVFAFGVYMTTLSSFMIWEDSGELATSVYTLGIPHPTGYPVFALLGRVFALLPLGDMRVIAKLNVMAALFCATAVFFYYRLFLRLLTDRLTFPVRSSGAALKAPGSAPVAGNPFVEPSIARVAAAVGVLALAFSWTFWAEAVSLEVYALHLLMVSIVTLAFLRALSRPESGRLWLLFAYMLGLSFSHHMMTVLLAPAFLTLYFSVHGIGRASWARIARAVPVFVLGLTPYLYLPLRASTGPLMNWGDPSTWERFLFHVSGGQYRFKMFSSADVAARKFQEFSTGYLHEFGFLPLALALLGLWAAYRFRRRLFAFTMLLFATGVVYAVNYDFEDPNFYLPAWIMVATWAALGAGFALTWARSRGRVTFWLTGIACCAAALQPLVTNYRGADESGNHSVEDYAMNVLGSVGPGGILYTDQSEMLVSPAYYLQTVEGVRPDVVLVDQSQMVAGHLWYFRGLERRHPDVVRGAWSFIQAYTDVVLEVRERMPLDGTDWLRYQDAYWKVVEALFVGDFGRRPVYATIDVATAVLPHIQKDVSPGVNVIPDGLVFRYFIGAVPHIAPKDFVYKPLLPGKGTVDKVSQLYAAGFANQAGYLILTSGDTAMARNFLRKSLELQPGFPKAAEWMRRIGP